MAQNQELQNAFAYIDKNKNRIIAENIKICKIPAPTFHEEKRAAYLVKRIKKLGFRNVKIDKVGNVVCRIAGKKPTIMLVAHTDTVFEDAKIEVRRKGDWLYAPGIGDDAIGINALLYVLELLKKGLLKIQNELIFGFVVGEEAKGVHAGMKFLMKQLKQNPDLVINVDGGKLKRICCIGVLIDRIKIELKAKGGHALGHFGEPSAVHTAGRIITEITGLRVPKKPRTSYNIGIIKGGTIVSALAQDCEMHVDLRSESKKQLALLKENVVGIANRAAKKDKVKIKISPLGRVTGGTSPRKSEIVKIAKNVMAALGIDGTEGSSTTDGNISISLGIPTITISACMDEFGHSLNERVLADSIPRGIKLAAAVLKNFSEKWK